MRKDLVKSGQMYAEPQQCFFCPVLLNEKHKALHETVVGDPVCTTLHIALDFK